MQKGKHFYCLVKYHRFHQSSEFSKKSDIEDTAFRLGKHFFFAVKCTNKRGQMTNFNKEAVSHNCILDSFCNSIYLFIFLYVLTPEGDIRRVPGNHVLGD